jgi:putative pyruvate formate lyase activating enzyme
MRMNENKIARIERAITALSPLETECTICPRRCRVDRTRGAAGVCRTGRRAAVSRALLHFGEEPVLSGAAGRPDRRPGTSRGKSGSGTIFFSGCNLRCLFCQNYQLSWKNEGAPVPDEELAEMMLGLEESGALNINFVSPTHVILPILRALRIACGRGLDIPLVYNSNGYDDPEVLARLDGIIDIYLPDLKYMSADLSGRFSGAADYFPAASLALREMAAQQPVLSLDREGRARRGTIVRHLVLPGHVDDSLSVLHWIRENISPHIGLSLMSQYHPCHEAPEELRKPLSRQEYEKITAAALGLGFENLFIQPEPFGPHDHLVPDFDDEEPFKWK